MSRRLQIAQSVAIACITVALLPCAHAVNPAWTRPVPPFRIAGNIFYVGSEDLASYLIATPQGDILINSDLEENVPLIQKNIETLGFRFDKIKILLISHGHYDHCGGSALIKKLTGAKYYVMDGDVSVVESGGKTDYQYAKDASLYFTPTKVDHVLHDGDVVSLGGTTLTAHRTAGHTKGTTTWSLDETQDGRLLHVVIVGGPYVNSGSKLVGNTEYPQIASDFAQGFKVLESLPCDVFLGAHGIYFGLVQKMERRKNGDKASFIDPEGYKAFVAATKADFEAELKRQQGH